MKKENSISESTIRKRIRSTVILNGTVPDEDVKRMIAESYDLIVMGKKVKINT